VRAEVREQAQERSSLTEQTGSKAPKGYVRDEDFAGWLVSKGFAQSEEEALSVLRDEVTVVQERDAWKDLTEQSGTWSPNDLAALSSEKDMKDAFVESLERVVASEGDEPRVGSGEDIVSVPEEFDATHMNAREKYVHDRFHAGRLAGAAILDPPRIASTKRQDLVREDEPWYIAAAFPKIFQTAAGDYWAFAQRRSDRRQSVSLGDWFLHALRGRDGRALKHPCFYYFAERVIS